MRGSLFQTLNRHILPKKHSWARRPRIIWHLALTAAITAGIFYFLFFADALAVKTVAIDGVSDGLRVAISSVIHSTIENKPWHLAIRKNILFFPANRVQTELIERFPQLKTLSIEKKYPHELAVNGQERQPLGIWCFAADNSCRYFDEDKVFWGDPPKSSGFLLTTIDDQRADIQTETVETVLFTAIRKMLKTISTAGVVSRGITIPAESVNEFFVDTDKDFYIVFNLDTDIAGQIGVLKIFLDQKFKDPNFHPSRIDLSIDGRVYYK